MILSVCNQKGGTGKSTTAANLATCFAADGKRTLLIDADPQHTALEWKADRPSGLPSVQVIGLPAPNLHKEIEGFKEDYDVILIDGGGRITATARAACMIADFIIIPTRPSKPDLYSTRDFLTTVIEEVRAMKDIAGGILINQLRTGTRVGRAGLDEISRFGYPVFNTVIHDLTVHQEAIAAGMSVIEYAKTSKAAKEVQALYSELSEALK